MIKQFSKILLLFLITISIGCTEKEEYIDEDVYTKLMLEFAIINSMNEAYLGDSTHDEFRLKILDQYGVTPEKFRESHEYYQQNIIDQLERMDIIGKLLRQERDSIQYAERDYRLAKQESADSLRQRILNGEVKTDTTDN